MLSGQHGSRDTEATSGLDGGDEDEEETVSRGRSRPSAQPNGVARSRPKPNMDGDDSSEVQDQSEVTSSGHEWDGGDDDEADEVADDEKDDEDLEMSDAEPVVLSEEEDAVDDAQPRLVISLKYPKDRSSPLTGEAKGTTPRSGHHPDVSPIPAATQSSTDTDRTSAVTIQPSISHKDSPIYRTQPSPIGLTEPSTMEGYPGQELPNGVQATESTNPHAFVFQHELPPRAPEEAPPVDIHPHPAATTLPPS